MNGLPPTGRQQRQAQPGIDEATEHSMASWEIQVAQLAAGFPYPATPDLAATVVERLNRASERAGYLPPLRPVLWGLVFLCLLVGGLLTMPPVRAAVLEFLQIGAVRIYLPAPTASPVPTAPTAERPGIVQVTPAPARTPTATPTATPRPRPTPTPLHLAGETTLAEAQERFGFPILLPTHPPDLGEPDRVYVQRGNGLVILVWMESNASLDGTSKQESERVRLALYVLGPGVQASKGDPPIIAQTKIDGRRAVWVEGLHMLQIQGREYDSVRLVGDNVLIWTRVEDGQTVTYRLETGLPAEEAVRIAESLQ